MSDKDRLINFLIYITEDSNEIVEVLKVIYGKKIVGENNYDFRILAETIQEEFLISTAVEAQRYIINSGVKVYSNELIYGIFKEYIEQGIQHILLNFNVSLISQLSYKKYEKKSLSKSILAISFSYINSKEFLILLDRQHQFTLCDENLNGIRKLIEMLRVDQCLVFEPEDGGFKATGICNESTVKHCPKFQLCSSGEWVLWVPSLKQLTATELLKCKHSKYYIGKSIEVDSLLRAYHINDYIDDHIYNMLVVKSVEELIKQSKGAILIFLKNCESFNRLKDRYRAFTLTPDYIDIDLISNYASIDGAIVCDYSGRCLGYGVILDGVANVYANLQRGSRYNSTKNFISLNKDSFGIVISDDGMMDVVTNF